jgi:ABC-type sugar transport system substrate-binding protein
VPTRGLTGRRNALADLALRQVLGEVQAHDLPIALAEHPEQVVDRLAVLDQLIPRAWRPSISCRLASLSSSGVLASRPLDLSTTVRREAAFRAALAAHRPAQEPVVIHGAAFTIPAGRQATAELLRRRGDITAILAGNDMIALGGYEALADAGLRCPGDVSVAGHNDMPLVSRVNPPLTTVAIPQHEIGAAAARALLALLRGAAPVARRQLLPTTLMVRGSTGPPRRRAQR